MTQKDKESWEQRTRQTATKHKETLEEREVGRQNDLPTPEASCKNTHESSKEMVVL